MRSYIEVKNVSKSYGGKPILQDASLSIEQGTTVGLVGANGSGKSVLFKILCGFEKPDRGSVYVRGNQWLSKPEIPCGHSRENWRKRNPTGHEQSGA